MYIQYMVESQSGHSLRNMHPVECGQQGILSCWNAVPIPIHQLPSHFVVSSHFDSRIKIVWVDFAVAQDPNIAVWHVEFDACQRLTTQRRVPLSAVLLVGRGLRIRMEISVDRSRERLLIRIRRARMYLARQQVQRLPCSDAGQPVRWSSPIIFLEHETHVGEAGMSEGLSTRNALCTELVTIGLFVYFFLTVVARGMANGMHDQVYYLFVIYADNMIIMGDKNSDRWYKSDREIWTQSRLVSTTPLPNRWTRTWIADR